YFLHPYPAFLPASISIVFPEYVDFPAILKFKCIDGTTIVLNNDWPVIGEFTRFNFVGINPGYAALYTGIAFYLAVIGFIVSINSVLFGIVGQLRCPKIILAPRILHILKAVWKYMIDQFPVFKVSRPVNRKIGSPFVGR